MYTLKLEEKVDWLSELLRQEKEHSNDFIQSMNIRNAFTGSVDVIYMTLYIYTSTDYLPRKLAADIQTGRKISFSQESNKTILSL